GEATCAGLGWEESEYRGVAVQGLRLERVQPLHDLRDWECRNDVRVARPWKHEERDPCDVRTAGRIEVRGRGRIRERAQPASDLTAEGDEPVPVVHEDTPAPARSAGRDDEVAIE